MKKRNKVAIAVLLIGLFLVPTGIRATTTDVAFNDENFPDENFRNHLKSTYSVFLDDDVFTPGELDQIEEMEIAGLAVKSLIGIEHFAKLKKIEASDNEVRGIDLTENIELVDISLADNKIEEIDLSKNILAENINLSNNYIGALDLAKNIKLVKLNLDNNELAEINLAKNTELTDLDLSNNCLANLDLSKNTKLTNANISPQQKPIYLMMLQDSFDMTMLGVSRSKVTDITNGTLNGNILNISNPEDPITYKYDVSNSNLKMNVELEVRPVDQDLFNVEVEGDTIYDNTPKNVVVTLEDENAFVDVEKIKFKKEGTTITETKPVTAGLYQVYVDIKCFGQLITNYEIEAFRVLEKELTIESIEVLNGGKTYDGELEVDIKGGNLKGVVPGDTITFTLGKGTLEDKNAGNNKKVNTNISITGAKVSNYKITQPENLVASVYLEEIDVLTLNAVDREYNATNIVDLYFETLPIITGDDVELVVGKGYMESPDAAKNKKVDTPDVKLTGADAGNYQLVLPLIAADIAKADLHVIPDNKEKFVNEDNPTLTLRYLGFKGEDYEGNALNKMPITKTNVTKQTDIGEYDIEADKGEAKNYNVVYSKGTFMVKEQRAALLPVDKVKRPTSGGYVLVGDSSNNPYSEVLAKDENPKEGIKPFLIFMGILLIAIIGTIIYLVRMQKRKRRNK